MGVKSDDKAKADAEKAAAEAAAKAAEDAKAAEEAKAAEDAKAKDGDDKNKKEKTFSKAELEAEKQKAIAAEKAKWESEKDLSELERIKKENEELRASNRLRDARDEVVAALSQAGNKSPELAFNAIKGDLKFDDAGKLLNSKDLIENLKTSYPEQFGTEKPDTGIDAGAGQKGGGEKITKESLAKMTPEEVNKLDWAEVSKVMAAK